MKNILIILAFIACYALARDVLGVRYTNVGGAGGYDQVVNMDPGVWPKCQVAGRECQKRRKNVNSKLAPFDEEMTVVFRGPMNVYNFAVYQPANDRNYGGEPWRKISHLDNGNRNNIVLLNNKGDQAKSGMWSICGGNSQSYATTDFRDAARNDNPGRYSTRVPGGQEFNVLQQRKCQNSCDGFSRGVAHHGWGGAKMFVFDVDMPGEGDHIPAIWVLNSQIVRSAQYGCNCRGMGAQGGCGEIDLLEVINPRAAEKAITQIYSFKGSTGGGDASWFMRPWGRAQYAAIFDMATDSITIQKLSGFNFGQGEVSKAYIDNLMRPQGKVEINFRR